MKTVAIFTDGACRGNPGPGGWGAVLRYEDITRDIYGSEPESTNNRMELMAAIRALSTLKFPCHVLLTTDSQYVKRGIREWIKTWKKNDWRTANKEPVKNIDLWQALDKACERHRIDWYWVKGHSGNEYNERADALANYAIDEMLTKAAKHHE